MSNFLKTIAVVVVVAGATFAFFMWRFIDALKF